MQSFEHAHVGLNAIRTKELGLCPNQRKKKSEDKRWKLMQHIRPVFPCQIIFWWKINQRKETIMRSAQKESKQTQNNHDCCVVKGVILCGLIEWRLLRTSIDASSHHPALKLLGAWLKLCSCVSNMPKRQTQTVTSRHASRQNISWDNAHRFAASLLTFAPTFTTCPHFYLKVHENEADLKVFFPKKEKETRKMLISQSIVHARPVSK